MYAVTYDLMNVKNYARLTDEMARLGGKRIALSVWVLSSGLTVATLRNHLVNFVDDDDRLLVIPFSRRPWSFNAMEEGLGLLNLVPA